MGGAQRQSHVGAAQCRLQSALARDLDNCTSTASSTAHQPPTSRQPTAAQPRLLGARVLGRTAGSAVPATCPGRAFPGSSGPRGAARSSSWQRLFLAQTVSEASAFHPCAVASGGCKKMKRTLWSKLHLLLLCTSDILLYWKRILGTR